MRPASSSLDALRRDTRLRHHAWLAPPGLVLGTLLLLGAVGSLAAPPPVHAADPAPEPAPAAAESGSTDWRLLVGAGLGVLFGALLAAWQIRGMKRDR